MTPLISIITPCYNSISTISQTIESVLNQSYSNIEYIIVDGQSTDGTLDIIKKYLPISQNRIRYVSEADDGIYDAMNKGISMANGELIGIINSDDWYEQDAIKIVVDAYILHGPAVYHGMLRIFQNDEESSVVITNHHFLANRMIQHPTCIVPKLYYSQYGLFNKYYMYAADYEFMIRLQKSGARFIPLYKILANFREGGASENVKSRLEALDIKKKYRFISKKFYYAANLKFRLANVLKSLLA